MTSIDLWERLSSRDSQAVDFSRLESRSHNQFTETEMNFLMIVDSMGSVKWLSWTILSMRISVHEMFGHKECR